MKSKHRVIKEIPEMQHLEKQVAETAAVVSEWKRSIGSIETQLNTSNLAALRAKKQRETHALAASLGDPVAIQEIKRARSEQHVAEQQVADLTVALPAAQTELASAEKAAASARHALAMHHGEKMMRERIAAAARIDAAFAEAAAAYGDYERLGRELQNFPDLNIAQGGMSHYENAAGFRRIAAALPAFFVKLFPTIWSNSDARQPLAASEAHFWQLPLEHPVKAKAA